jgi:hypothetical protein
MLNSQTGQFQRYSPGGQPIYTHHANPISKINVPRYDEPHLNHHLIGILMKKPALLLALCLLFGSAFHPSTSTPSVVFAQAPQPTQATPPPPPAAPKQHKPTAQSQTSAPVVLSNNNHYTNSSGNVVHSPAKSSGGVPAGATAACRDGSYSFSQHRQGTCSHHGGVSSWL